MLVVNANQGFKFY